MMLCKAVTARWRTLLVAILSFFAIVPICNAQANYTALWWNPSEAGWGVNVNHQSNTLFATLFTYDEVGRPMWLVMSSGDLQAGTSTFVGDLFRTTGARFNTTPFPPLTAANVTKVGTMTLAFNSVNSGTLTYVYNGTTVTKAIQPQIFASRGPICSSVQGTRLSLTTYQDLWWNSAEPGWGLNLTHQDDTLFGTLFTYGADGQGLWLVMSSGQRQSDGSYVGDLFKTSGPAFNAQPFAPITQANITLVGSMSLRFSSGESGVLTYSVDGATVTKQITRQVFGTSVPSCVPPLPARVALCRDEGFFSMGCSPVSVPYSSSSVVQATIIGASQTTLDSFQITAVDGALTIGRIVALDTNNFVIPSIAGLREGQVIQAGQTVRFSLVSPLTRNRQANLRFSFSANGVSVFDATYAFRSN